MKRCPLLFLLLLFAGIGLGQSPSFKTYVNPVIPGDHPDPTMTRIGKYFYTTGSSFNPTPVIYRSTDMVHWEAIAQPVSSDWKDYGDGPSGGIWGGHLVYHLNKYWHFFGHWGTMYFVTADRPEGPWSAVTKMTTPTAVTSGLGQDNSIFIDDDGKWYLLVKASQESNWIVELGSNGQPAGRILDLRWLNPSPAYPYGWAEGPVMGKYRGFYYYYVSRSAGEQEYVFRSKILSDKKEDWQYLGELLKTDFKANSLFKNVAHNSAPIVAPDSTFWIMSHSYLMNGYNDEWAGQGRQGILTQLKWSTLNVPYSQYPLQEAIPAPTLPSGGVPWMVPKSDFFDANLLHPEWSFLGFMPKTNYSLTVRPGWLRMVPYGTKARMICKNDAEHSYSLITRLDFDPVASTQEAGLRIVNGNENSFVKLYSTFSVDKRVIRFTFENIAYETENLIGPVLWLKMVRQMHQVSAYYSANGIDYTLLGNPVNIASIDKQQPNYNSWTGNRQGLFVLGKSADFDLYIYRDAYSSILAECPANLSGVKGIGALNGIGYLDEIHHNDWALYAGVEFGQNTDPLTALYFEAQAASTAPGGNIEVWLDSISTGRKIGDCPIESSGSLSTFKIYTAKVDAVTGRHDVYLRFTGAPSIKLFRFKVFTFSIKPNFPDGVNQLPVKKNSFILYPNPASNQLTVEADEKFKELEITDISGQKVYVQKLTDPVPLLMIPLRLSKGLYFIRLKNEQLQATEKLVVE